MSDDFAEDDPAYKVASKRVADLILLCRAKLPNSASASVTSRL